MRRASAFLLVLAGVALAGCGGGGGGGGSAPYVSVQFTIDWPARSRALDAPTAALSAIVTFVGVGRGGADVIASVDRPDGTSSASQSVTTTSAARSGHAELRVLYYAERGGRGDVVARAGALITIGTSGSLYGLDGSLLGKLSYSSDIRAVSVAPGQQLLVGETRDLLCHATDANGTLLAIAEGSVFWDVVAGAERVACTQAGSATGVSSGTSYITASVNGLVSAPEAVTVPPVVVRIDQRNPSVVTGGSVALTATVSGAVNTAVTWSVSGGGTILPSGAFAAGDTTGTFTVTATSCVDPSQSDSVELTINLPSSVIVYTNDFEAAVGAEWSRPRATQSPSGRRFLGEFADDTVTLVLDGLPRHSSLRVAFDLYIILGWDGLQDDYQGAPVGPDVWWLKLAGSDVLRTTFANNNFAQSYPGSYPGAAYPRRTGAVEVDTLGYLFGQQYPLDAVYRIDLVVPHSGQAADLEFGAVLQGVRDETWGLDNLTVQANP